MRDEKPFHTLLQGGSVERSLSGLKRGEELPQRAHRLLAPALIEDLVGEPVFGPKSVLNELQVGAAACTFRQKPGHDRFHGAALPRVDEARGWVRFQNLAVNNPVEARSRLGPEC